MGIPATPSGITAEYLTAVLRQSGTIKDNSVKSVEVRMVPAGSGFAGQGAYVTIEYERESNGAPAKMFAKMSSADAEVRGRLRSIGLYEAETGFYRDLSHQAKIRVPRAYACLYDPKTGACLLLIEDIRHLRFADHVAGCTAADARTVVTGVARMHAHYWRNEKLLQCAWLRSAETERARLAELYRAMLPRWEQKWAHLNPPGVIRAAHALAGFFEVWHDSHLTDSWTLVHGDFRPDNLAFDESGEVVAFDWQTARRYPSSRDLAYYIASLKTELRRENEAELLELYHRTLAANGVRDYSMEELRVSYRRSMGTPLYVHVVAGGLMDFSSERGQELARVATERLDAVIEDHNFAEWKPGN